MINKSIKRKRYINLHFRVMEEEKEMILKKMELYGTENFGVYARKMLIDGLIIKQDFKELRSLTGELGKIGSNINQIAKRANETRIVYKNDISDLLNKFHNIELLVIRIVSKLIDK